MARRTHSVDRLLRRSRRRSVSRRLAAEQLESRRLLSASGGGALLGPLQNVVVVLNDDVADSRSAAVQLIGQPGQAGSVGHTYQHALKGFSGQVYSARAMQASPLVKYVEVDGMMHTLAQTLPTGVDRIDADLNPVANIDGVHTELDVDIAIIDTGIDVAHPDLNVVGGVRVFRDGGSPFNPKIGYDDNYDDDNGHGTHVAGSAAAIDNGIGVVGVAPGARLWAVKVLDQNGSGSYSQVIAGMDWVTERAGDIEVANMSLGGGYSQSVNDALAGMTSAGVVVAVAAGNDGADAGNYSPASAPTAITVSAAVDTDGQGGGLGSSTTYGPDDTLASFSNYGSVIDIAAPGVNIYSTVPGGYDTYSGTSMASPHVAGAAALEILAHGNGQLNGDYVQTIRDALVAAGQPMAEWRSDDEDIASDPDGINEPMVYVGAEIDQPPTADDISVTSDEDIAIDIELSGSDAETVELFFEIISGPSFGTLSEITNMPGLVGDPNTDTAMVTYTPDPDYNGSDSFIYQVEDENGGTAQGVVSLTINPVNDAPVAVADTYTMTAGTILEVDAANGVLANDSDVDGDTLTAVRVTDVTYGELALAGDGSFTYTPNEGSSADDSFTYYATDGSLNSETVTVTINMNNPPVADIGGPYSGTEDFAIIFDASNTIDEDGDTLTYTWDFGDGTVHMSDSPTITHVYKWGGLFDVTLTVSDGRGGTDSSTTTADVTEVNDVPVADAGGPYSGIEGEAITFDASGSYDYDNQDGTTENDQTLTYKWDFGDGTVTDFSEDPTIDYIYAVAGEYTVTLTVDDGTASDEATTSALVAEVTTMHIGALDGEAVDNKNQWRALVTITVLDANGQPLSDATVTGNWSDGHTVNGTTDETGKVTLPSNWVHKKNESLTFSVTDVSHATLRYEPSSDGTSITIWKDGTTTTSQSSSVAATDSLLAGALDDLFVGTAKTAGRR